MAIINTTDPQTRDLFAASDAHNQGDNSMQVTVQLHDPEQSPPEPEPTPIEFSSASELTSYAGAWMSELILSTSDALPTRWFTCVAAALDAEIVNFAAGLLSLAVRKTEIKAAALDAAKQEIQSGEERGLGWTETCWNASYALSETLIDGALSLAGDIGLGFGTLFLDCATFKYRLALNIQDGSLFEPERLAHMTHGIVATPIRGTVAWYAVEGIIASFQGLPVEEPISISATDTVGAPIMRVYPGGVRVANPIEVPPELAARAQPIRPLITEPLPVDAPLPGTGLFGRTPELQNPFYARSSGGSEPSIITSENGLQVRVNATPQVEPVPFSPNNFFGPVPKTSRWWLSPEEISSLQTEQIPAVSVQQASSPLPAPLQIPYFPYLPNTDSEPRIAPAADDQTQFDFPSGQKDLIMQIPSLYGDEPQEAPGAQRPDGTIGDPPTATTLPTMFFGTSVFGTVLDYLKRLFRKQALQDQMSETQKPLDIVHELSAQFPPSAKPVVIGNSNIEYGQSGDKAYYLWNLQGLIEACGGRVADSLVVVSSALKPFDGSRLRSALSEQLGSLDVAGRTQLMVRSSARGDAWGTGVYSSIAANLSDLDTVVQAMDDVVSSYETPWAESFRKAAGHAEGLGILIQPHIGFDEQDSVSGLALVRSPRDVEIKIQKGPGSAVQTHDPSFSLGQLEKKLAHILPNVKKAQRELYAKTLGNFLKQLTEKTGNGWYLEWVITADPQTDQPTLWIHQIAPSSEDPALVYPQDAPQLVGTITLQREPVGFRPDTVLSGQTDFTGIVVVRGQQDKDLLEAYGNKHTGFMVVFEKDAAHMYGARAEQAHVVGLAFDPSTMPQSSLAAHSVGQLRAVGQLFGLFDKDWLNSFPGAKVTTFTDPQLPGRLEVLSVSGRAISDRRTNKISIYRTGTATNPDHLLWRNIPADPNGALHVSTAFKSFSPTATMAQLLGEVYHSYGFCLVSLEGCTAEQKNLLAALLQREGSVLIGSKNIGDVEVVLDSILPPDQYVIILERAIQHKAYSLLDPMLKTMTNTSLSQRSQTGWIFTTSFPGYDPYTERALAHILDKEVWLKVYVNVELKPHLRGLVFHDPEIGQDTWKFAFGQRDLDEIDRLCSRNKDQTKID